MVRATLCFAFQKVAFKRAGRKKSLAVHHFASESGRVKYQEVLAKKFNSIVDGSEVTAGSCWSVMSWLLLKKLLGMEEEGNLIGLETVLRF